MSSHGNPFASGLTPVTCGMRVAWLLVSLLTASCAAKAVTLVMSGDEHSLRARPATARQSSHDSRPLMLLALDGVSRSLLYEMIRRHELPNFSALIGNDAYFDDSLLSTLPSTTMPAWVTTMTGVGPAEHGVTGNEFFVRETETFACPAPVSFNDLNPTLAIYTDRYLDKLVEVPTVYERMRAKDPDVLIWVSMNHLFRGADKLLLANHSLIAKAMLGLIDIPKSKAKMSRKVFAQLDTAAINAVVDHLNAAAALPDVMTVYLSGTDLYAHVAEEGPDVARRAYLREIVDPALGTLVTTLRARGMLDRMWTMIVADHGHTAVPHDAPHALGAGDGPATVLRNAGFKVRPFQQNVDAKNPFNAVLAYGGAMAYVYVADRTLCGGANEACSWKLPPRYEEDVLAVADAFYRNNLDGSFAPEMKGALDMVLTRKPKPYAEVDLPFEVYVGEGKTVPIEDYLHDHPHPSYIALAERMRALAVGTHGERAGDILLIAHNGDRGRRDDRFYFAQEYRSWHGSPSRDDSEIPLIVANHRRSREQIRVWVKHILGDDPYQQKVTDLMLGLHAGALGP